MLLGVLIESVRKHSEGNSLLLDVPFTPDPTFHDVSECEATELGTVVSALSWTDPRLRFCNRNIYSVLESKLWATGLNK